MGCCTSENDTKKKSAPKKPLDEPDFTPKKYESKYNKYFKELEGKSYNFFLNIPFVDMAYALKFFSMDNATVDCNYNAALDRLFNGSYKEFQDIFDENYFITFLDNRVAKHKKAYENAVNNPQKFQLFKEYFVNIFKGLLLKLQKEDKQKAKDEGKEEQVEIAPSDRIRKLHILAILILFCEKAAVSKVKAIFETFAVERILSKSPLFEEFLISLFFIGAYCSLDARHQVNAEGFNEMDRDEIKKVLDAMEAKDSRNLVKETCKRIFGENGDRRLGYEEFKALFTDKNENTTVDYILSPEGVRKFQEIYNV